MMKKMYMPIIFVLMFFQQACQKADKEQEPSLEKMKDQVSAVCIWDGASLRAEPSSSGKWLSSIALGETVIWLGESAVDSSDKNREYKKIRLSDGKEGWASRWVIVPDARPAISLQTSAIYRRPDLLTITDKSFDPMEMFAVVKEDSVWLDVIGAERKNKGWIKRGAVSFDKVDITVALLFKKAKDLIDIETRKERLKAIVNNPEFSNSIFLEDVQEELNQYDLRKRVR
jgi:hypothetical protein